MPTNRALIIEDNRDLAELEAIKLKSIKGVNYDVSIAASAAEAVEEFRRLSPDVVVLDLRLGSMDGLQLLSSIRRDHGPYPPILVVSGFITAEVSAYVGLFANVAVLPKSRLDELPAAVSNLVAQAEVGPRMAAGLD